MKIELEKNEVVRSAEVTFRYEQPDLVREGIVFEHCTSVP